MRTFTVLAVVLAGAVSSYAQTNDQLFRSWRWSPEAGSARTAGMGGAFAAVADGSEASWLNPAGLATLAKSEVGAGLARSSSAA